eukprot:gene36693-49458_t
MTTLLLGHKGRCFDVRRYIYEEKDFIYTASEDGTAKLWKITETTPSLSSSLPSSTIALEGRCIATLNHSANRISSSEVLRACALGPDNDRIKLLCTAGSDGIMNIFTRDAESINLKYKKSFTLNHRNEESQVYCCESLSQLNSSEDAIFITAADNELYLWNSTLGTESVHKWSFSGEKDV